jgi:hypothetical protein
VGQDGDLEFEQAITNANNLNVLCKAIRDGFVDELKSSIVPTVATSEQHFNY